mgnify:CR=1 FL=1
MPLSNIASRWRNGVLEYYDTRTNEVVDVAAPMKKFDDFTGAAVDTTNDWTFAAVNSGAITINAAAGGHARITTGDADDDDAELASGLIFNTTKGCVMEARLAMNDADKTAMCVGFSDATGEAADKLAITFATATATTNASNAALFFQDPDATTDAFRCMSVNANTDSTVYTASATAAALTDATMHRYRVEILTDQTVKFWFDDDHVATIGSGIAANTAVTTYVGLINREAEANTLDIDYIRAWALTR